jgi:hypothetical protein
MSSSSLSLGACGTQQLRYLEVFLFASDTEHELGFAEDPCDSIPGGYIILPPRVLVMVLLVFRRPDHRSPSPDNETARDTLC